MQEFSKIFFNTLKIYSFIHIFLTWQIIRLFFLRKTIQHKIMFTLRRYCKSPNLHFVFINFEAWGRIVPPKMKLRFPWLNPNFQPNNSVRPSSVHFVACVFHARLCFWQNDLTGEHSCVMLKELHSDEQPSQWLSAFRKGECLRHFSGLSSHSVYLPTEPCCVLQISAGVSCPCSPTSSAASRRACPSASCRTRAPKKARHSVTYLVTYKRFQKVAQRGHYLILHLASRKSAERKKENHPSTKSKC